MSVYIIEHSCLLCRASSITRGEATYNIEVYVTIDGVRQQVTDICTNCYYVVSVQSDYCIISYSCRESIHLPAIRKARWWVTIKEKNRWFDRYQKLIIVAIETLPYSG